MMDRNLGATSATPGDACTLGLLYQWGRKDPFLGSSSITSSKVASSTISWPSTVKSDPEKGTIEYATKNPTTFITANKDNKDWHYASDKTRWASSELEKSIYDPCPIGWRVPDWEIWRNAGFDDHIYDKNNKGISFSLSSSMTTWYPSTGCLSYNLGELVYLGYGEGYYWSASVSTTNGLTLYFNNSGAVSCPAYDYFSYGCAVRCVKE